MVQHKRGGSRINREVTVDAGARVMECCDVDVILQQIKVPTIINLSDLPALSHLQTWAIVSRSYFSRFSFFY